LYWGYSEVKGLGAAESVTIGLFLIQVITVKNSLMEPLAIHQPFPIILLTRV
jgi:hypothetical protein